MNRQLHKLTFRCHGASLYIYYQIEKLLTEMGYEKYTPAADIYYIEFYELELVDRKSKVRDVLGSFGVLIDEIV